MLIRWSNVAVLVSSAILIVIASIETLSTTIKLSTSLFLTVQLISCFVFLFDFVLRIIPEKRRLRFFFANILMLVVSIPYINIVVWSGVKVTPEMHLVLRSLPLIRGIFGVVIIINWITKNRVSNLFYSYLITMLSATYYSSVIFYSVEKEVNPDVERFWDAIWWASLNVTTVGSSIHGVTFLGQLLAPLLACVGMMMFPIFTVFITNRFAKHYKR